MDVSRLAGGIILLALAAMLTVLAFTLPEGDVVFMIGDANVPLLPAAVMAAVGVWLLATAQRKGAEAKAPPSEKELAVFGDPAKIKLNERLETVGWGLFLIMLGGFSLVPDETIPKGVWSIGLGLIFLGLNLARYLNGIRMSGFTTFIGVLSLLTGIAQLLGFNALDGALFLIILGAYLLLKPWFDRRQVFGKVQES